jgi:ABC-type branched-subunit amino acid transport system ATPase component
MIEVLAGLKEPSGGEIALGSDSIASWHYPTGKALRDLLIVIWSVLFFEVVAIEVQGGPFTPSGAAGGLRLVVQSVIIVGLIQALKRGTKWAPALIGVAAACNLVIYTGLLISGKLSGFGIAMGFLHVPLLLYAVVLAIRTHKEFAENLTSELVALTPRQVKELGVGHIPEDRHRRGLLLEFDLAENAILGVHYRKPFVSYADVILDSGAIRKRAKEIIEGFDVRPANAALPARALSGGNQQKLIIGREFKLEPKLLLVSQPTRGVDIGAIEFIHRKLVSLRDSGCAILLVSAELEEVTSLSDRLLIIHEGRIVGEVDPKVATVEEIGLLMTRGH